MMSQRLYKSAKGVSYSVRSNGKCGVHASGVWGKTLGFLSCILLAYFTASYFAFPFLYAALCAVQSSNYLSPGSQEVQLVATYI